MGVICFCADSDDCTHFFLKKVTMHKIGAFSILLEPKMKQTAEKIVSSSNKTKRISALEIAIWPN